MMSKKLRFEIFKRDAFRCGYCGRTPPEVKLECDHIIPECKGGQTALENLITACFDCNRGKAGNKLGTIPVSLQENAEEIKERRTQLKAYERLLRAEKNDREKAVKEIQSVFGEFHPGHRLSPRFVESSLKSHFLPKLPVYEIAEGMRLACSRIADRERAVKYFCGICWKKIRDGRENA